MHSRWVGRGATVLVACLLVAGPVAPTAHAAAATRTYVVNSAADRPDADVGTPGCADSKGKCTLRAAIMQANFHAGADTIVLPAGTFKLTRPGDDDVTVLGDLDITDSLTIKGAGSSRTIVDGNGSVTNDRVFQVLAGAQNTTFSGMTIRNGRRLGTFQEGGGLLWQGNGSVLTMSDVVVENNRAYDYGGVALEFSTMGDSVDLNRVTVSGNHATAAAGGLGLNLGAFAQVVLRNSRIHANVAYEGGGLYLQGDAGPDAATSISIRNTEIDANTASLSAGVENHSGTVGVPVVFANDWVKGNDASVYGGGIGNYGVVDASASTLSGNTAASRGAGLYGYAGGSSNLADVTIAGNVSSGYGGGIYAEVFTTTVSTVSLMNVTLRRNAASTSGGGIYADTGAVVTMTNTLLAVGTSGANCSALFGGSFSLSDDGSCGFGAGDNVALMLGTLGNYGGRTETVLPLTGSPAIDAGTSGGAPAADQRGIARPQGAAVDVGAVEVCPGKPLKPVLVAPVNTTLHTRRPVLNWNDVPCIQGYSVVVRRGSSTGPKVQTGTQLGASKFKTKALTPGTYYWRVTAVGDQGKTNSAWRHFKIA